MRATGHKAGLSRNPLPYFLPEDGDVEAAPNVFLGPTPARPGYPPLLGQIRDNFPLPGQYHFRFKTALVPGADRDRNPAAVWLDCVNDAEPVPLWQGAIVAKVTRLGPDPGDAAPAAAADVPIPATVESGVSASAPPRSVAEASSTHSSASLLGAFDDHPLAASASGASSVHSSAGNLLDVDHPPVPAPASGGSLLDLDHHHSGAASAPRTEHHDLLNMAAPAPASGPGPAARAPMAPMQGQMPMQYPPQGQGQYAAQQRGMGKQPQRPQNMTMNGLHDPLGGLM